MTHERLVLLLGVLAGCSAEPEVPNLACRWQYAGVIEDTVADRCLMVVTITNSSVGDSCSGAARQCIEVESGSVEWFRDGWEPTGAEVQSFYVDCSETCADYGFP